MIIYLFFTNNLKKIVSGAIGFILMGSIYQLDWNPFEIDDDDDDDDDDDVIKYIYKYILK